MFNYDSSGRRTKHFRRGVIYQRARPLNKLKNIIFDVTKRNSFFANMTQLFALAREKH